jgi:hypothetical protein
MEWEAKELMASDSFRTQMRGAGRVARSAHLGFWVWFLGFQEVFMTSRKRDLPVL